MRRERGLYVVGAGADPPATADWVVFGAVDRLPPADVIEGHLPAAGSADVVLLAPGRRRSRRLDLAANPGAVLPDDALPVFAVRTLSERGLRFADTIDPDLAATLLAARCLTALDRPRVTVGGLPRASRPPAHWQRASRYSELPARYAELLGRVRADRGAVPRWLQSLVVGQVFALLREDAGLSTIAASLAPADVDAFHTALREIRARLDADVVTAHPATGITDELRAALLIGAAAIPAHTKATRRTDAARGLARVSYLFTGTAPEERIVDAGVPVESSHHKIRTVDVVARPLMSERIAWVPERAVLTLTDQDEIDVRATRPSARLERLSRIVAENPGLARSAMADVRIRARARSRASRERYADAWLLMDRDIAAQDNAEHLYRHLRAEQPGINAWFVLAREAPDWRRLSDEGFRLLEFGSDEHFVALLHCVHLVSSQVDDYVITPFRKHLLGNGRWRFTFLQHGVLRHDLSRWLNRKKMDLFVTSTPDEQHAVVADRTPYVFTDLETRMTGLARHDRLLRLADATPERTSLLVMPTWRNNLLGEQAGGNDRGLLADFWRTPYAQAWRELLASDRLRAICDDQGWQLVFVPHPNMQDYLVSADLPDHVSALRYKDIDIQQVLATTATVVTDYSSLANEAAYIRRPVVYYQFDRSEFFAGGHFHRLGEWRYERDGFGPVTATVDATVDAVTRIAALGGAEPEYATRIENGFPLRDGLCCARTVTEIRRLGVRA